MPWHNHMTYDNYLDTHRSASQELLAVLTGRHADVKAVEAKVAKYLLHEAVDPNRSRPSLLQSVERRTHTYRPNCA